MLDDRLLDSLSIYQDIVVNGVVVRKGRRACLDRWKLIEPWLPRQGVLLDVGSNFGWFCVTACRERPSIVAASIEADQRSAAVQREVLAENNAHRVCLLTQRAGPKMAQVFANTQQRFAAMFCLSVLHWIPSHREFLRRMDSLVGRFFIEQPDPRESGAGDAALRREIGELESYLSTTFPDRKITKLGETISHRDEKLPRPLWLVHERTGESADEAGLSLAAICKLAPIWPTRSWWMAQLSSTPWNGNKRGSLTPEGLSWSDDPNGWTWRKWSQVFQRFPEERPFGTLDRWGRTIRNWLGGVRHMFQR